MLEAMTRDHADEGSDGKFSTIGVWSANSLAAMLVTAAVTLQAPQRSVQILAVLWQPLQRRA